MIRSQITGQKKTLKEIERETRCLQNTSKIKDATKSETRKATGLAKIKG
jgi:hypothetical protein